MIERKENGMVSLGRWEVFIQIIVFISLADYTVETLPDLSNLQIRIISSIEIFTIVIFTIEFFIRILFSRKPLKYLFSLSGAIDLLTILPFYLSIGFDLRTLKLFRLARILRILKLTRYNNALKRYARAMQIAKEELVLFGMFSLFIIYISSVLIYMAENPAQPEIFSSIFDAMWWSIATLTTVGYGDIYPITPIGKLFTFFILIVGLGIVAVTTGLLASALSQARQEEIAATIQTEIAE